MATYVYDPETDRVVPKGEASRREQTSARHDLIRPDIHLASEQIHEGMARDCGLKLDSEGRALFTSRQQVREFEARSAAIGRPFFWGQH